MKVYSVEYNEWEPYPAVICSTPEIAEQWILEQNKPRKWFLIRDWEVRDK